MKATAEDKRVRRTKRLLQDSLIELLKEKKYERITVTDIIEHADFNRATFYRHYLDKDDLVEQLKEELLDDFMRDSKLIHEKKNEQRTIELSALTVKDIFFFDYIYERRNYFILWKHSNDLPKFQERFLEVFLKLFKQGLIINYHKSIDLDENDLTGFLCYGAMGMIIEWIRNDFAEKPETLTRRLLTIIGLLNIADIEITPIEEKEFETMNHPAGVSSQ